MSQLIRYSIDTFFDKQYSDSSIPAELLPYTVSKQKTKTDLTQYRTVLSNVNNANLKDCDINDITTKNNIKMAINSLTSENIMDQLEKIKSNNYDEDRLKFLAYELISVSMSCQFAINGYEEKTKNKTVSYTIVRLINYLLMEKDKFGVSFKNNIIDLCQKFFSKYVYIQNSMDKNNEYSTENYKGLMSFIGLLYEFDIIHYDIIDKCIEMIKRTIYCSNTEQKQKNNNLFKYNNLMMGAENSSSDLYCSIIYYDTDANLTKLKCFRNKEECINFYKGYVNMVNLFLARNKRKQTKEEIDTTVVQNMMKFMKDHSEFLEINNKFYIDDKTKPMNAYLIGLHNDLTKNAESVLVNVQ